MLSVAVRLRPIPKLSVEGALGSAFLWEDCSNTKPAPNMPLHHLTGILASTSICGSMCSPLISFSEWSVALRDSCWWAQSCDSCCVESRAALLETSPRGWTTHPSLHDTSGLFIFHSGLMMSYRVCRAGRWLWWCGRTLLRVCGSPTRLPTGRTAAPSALPPPAGRSCPTPPGTWLHKEQSNENLCFNL